MAPLPKRTRIGKPKARTGCITCKTRHIKCDEGRPSCKKCLASGWDCEGYIKVPLTTAITTQPFIQQQDVNFSPTPQISPYHTSSRELRSFQYFLSKSASSIPGSFSSDFWKIQLPQTAHRHKAIRHAIVAVASLHEAAVNTCSAALGLWTVDDIELAARYRFALQQYSLAIQATRHLMAEADKGMEEVALLNCVLFICFEFLQSRFNVAAVHLRNGLQIMREWQHRSTRRTTKTQGSALRDNLVQIFDRLSITSFLMDEPLSYICSGSAPMPEESIDGEDNTPFSSIQEAQNDLDQLLLESFSKRKLCEELAISSLDSRWEEMSTYLFNFRARLAQWDTRFSAFLSTHSGILTSSDSSAVHVLHRTQLATSIWASTALSPEETAYDTHFSAFMTITNHVEEQMDEERANDRFLHDFTLETGFLSHTYFVARKCRDRGLRRRALRLLERASPRQEGVFKAGMLASVARRIIEMEEEGMEVFDCDRDDNIAGDGEERSLERLPSEEKRVVDTCGVSGDNIWAQDWKNGRGGIIEHELLLMEEKVTFVSRPGGVGGPMAFRTEVIPCTLSKSMSMKG